MSDEAAPPGGTVGAIARRILMTPVRYSECHLPIRVSLQPIRAWEKKERFRWPPSRLLELRTYDTRSEAQTHAPGARQQPADIAAVYVLPTAQHPVPG